MSIPETDPRPNYVSVTVTFRIEAGGKAQMWANQITGEAVNNKQLQVIMAAAWVGLKANIPALREAESNAPISDPSGD